MPRKGADPLITRLEPLRPRGLRVRVHLDRGEPFEVFLEAVDGLRLGVGDPLPANRRHHLLNVDADVKIREAALNLLSFRARTRSELRQRLLAKGLRPARIDLCLDRLQDRGLLDDAAVAAAFVRDRLRHRPRGKVRLVQELRGRGIESNVASQVVAQVLEDESVTESALAQRAVEAWLGRQSAATLRALASRDDRSASEKAYRRLRGHLTRRGFGGQILAQAIATARRLAAR
ncbi:MAG: recombination regulator RecX [Gemmatimonadetes bacterium]|nr:recombination regulator RecX [Gemmatimonadota bacterium]